MASWRHRSAPRAAPSAGDAGHVGGHGPGGQHAAALCQRVAGLGTAAALYRRKEEVREAIQRDSRKLLALDLKAAEEAAKRKEQAERERLRIEDLTRRNYGLASEWTVNERKRLSRNGGRPQPPPTRPMPPTPPRPMPPTHAGKVRDQKRQRENSHGR